MENEIKVVELFAGVGGFRLGLEGWNGKSASSRYKDKIVTPYKVLWSNQWEPSTKTQHASLVYENRFGKKGHSNQDIAKVEISEIPNHDLLVGGFPCQDYSVATTLKNSKGLIGKKGVLWWSIHKILSEIQNKPKYLFLENVDRILISPSGQRGRDFAIILKSENNELILRKVKIWNMPYPDVLEAKKVWTKTKEIVSKGEIVKKIVGSKRYTNLPNKAYNSVSHVRPHASKTAETYPLPINDNFTNAKEYTKHCFWLNNTYVRDEIYLK